MHACVYSFTFRDLTLPPSTLGQVYSGLVRKASEEKFSYVVIQKRPKQIQQKQPAKKSKIVPLKKMAEDANNKVVTKDFGLWTEQTALATNPSQDEAHPTTMQVLERFASVREREDVMQLLDKLIDEV